MKEKAIIKHAKMQLTELDLTSRYENSLSFHEMAKILHISGLDRNLNATIPEILTKRINENGCYTIRKENELVGCIFMHKHEMGRITVYERVTLWVAEPYRKNGFGFLLMAKISAHYVECYTISISKNNQVCANNELLGMKHLSLDEIPEFVLDTLRTLGKLRGADYKYYVNHKLYVWLQKLKELE